MCVCVCIYACVRLTHMRMLCYMGHTHQCCMPHIRTCVQGVRVCVRANVFILPVYIFIAFDYY